MKKFAAIGLLAFTLTSCVSPSKVNAEMLQLNIETKTISVTGESVKVQSDFLSKVETQIKKRQLSDAVKNLRKHVGRTWYVFSGSTPSGWDCSGLVMWTYEQLGFELKHRASAQGTVGTKVKNPKIGDIVTFTYKGSKSAYHVGIYIGNGKMVHAPSPGKLTRIESVKKFAKNYSKISYRRLVHTT